MGYIIQNFNEKRQFLCNVTHTCIKFFTKSIQTRVVRMRECPPKALFPQTVTLNPLLGSDDPDYCNFKTVSSWPPCIQSKKRAVCKTCTPP